MSEQKHLVEVRNLKKYFPIKSGMMNKVLLKAVDDVSFTIDEGETLGLVGESGCGKTTVGRTLLHLYKPTAGEVYFDGNQVTEKNIGNFLVILLAVIQIADISPAIMQKYYSMVAYRDQFEILTDTPFFKKNRNTYNNVNCPGNSAYRGLYVALWCSENNMSTNFPFLARYDADQHAKQAEKTRASLLNGIYDEDTLYLFSSEDESLFHDVAYHVNSDKLICGKAGKEFYFIAPANDKFSLPVQDESFILYDDLPLTVADYSDDIWDHGVLLSKPNTITFLNNDFSWSFLDGASAIYCDGIRYYIERIYDDPGYIMVEVGIEDGHVLTGKSLSTDIRK